MDPLPGYQYPSSPDTASVIKRGSGARNLVTRLRNHIVVIGSVFFSITSVALIVIVAYGFTHPALIVCLVVSLALAGLLLSTPTRRYVRREFGSLFPKEFLSIIKKEYPEVLCNLIIQERLTFQELRVVLSGLSSGIFDFPSDDCKNRVERYGIRRLQKACRGIPLPDLEKILLKNCPFYLMNKFIQLGPKEFPEVDNLPPEIYWLSYLGLTDYPHTFFDPYFWILSRVVTQEEYEILLKHAKNSTWDQIKDLTKDLELRVEEGLDLYFVSTFDPKKSLKKLMGGPWLLSLCKHGVSWEQLQLLKDIDCENLCLMHHLDISMRGKTLMKFAIALSPYIDENDPENFDRFITLLTFDELWAEYKRNEDKLTWCFYDAILTLLNQRSINSAKKCWDEDTLLAFQYELDRRTGKKVLIGADNV
ncbi:DUF1389 domain-containing protein [Chlamydia sp. 12-01]|uniref:DUF1389 domain-containing protein n=1 Tax=Chlamydia sp. 12-01 TaxID=3002742 RepID=UPI0035D47DD1